MYSPTLPTATESYKNGGCTATWCGSTKQLKRPGTLPPWFRSRNAAHSKPFGIDALTASYSRIVNKRTGAARSGRYGSNKTACNHCALFIGPLHAKGAQSYMRGRMSLASFLRTTQRTQRTQRDERRWRNDLKNRLALRFGRCRLRSSFSLLTFHAFAAYGALNGIRAFDHGDRKKSLKKLFYCRFTLDIRIIIISFCNRTVDKVVKFWILFV